MDMDYTIQVIYKSTEQDTNQRVLYWFKATFIFGGKTATFG